ncbi:MAG: dihydroorotate dehydrogenase electron transfer subunit [Promethearchaeota archaeon]|nr:MAG: dihydroorotate dehydrogenase electron transfer subunit [Candidatus Lokiarchaeota archaeon]
MSENIIRTVAIEEAIMECEDVKTIKFNMKNENTNYIIPRPGQFVMLWVPGVDEVPMSVSGCDINGNWSITVKNIGECTDAIFNLKRGDFIGVRGPLGNWFEIPEQKSKNIFVIGGGIGMAPLRFLTEELSKHKIPFILIQGAKVKSELMFANQFQILDKKSVDIFYCTEDGSYGSKGIPTEAFETILETYSKRLFSNAIVYTCGPEKMIYSIYEICEKWDIELHASLERIMRCGCGLCGLCVIDPLGLLVCKDGPVFKTETLKNMEDFGKFKRDFTGRKVEL